MERGICPIAMLYFATDVPSLAPETVVGRQCYKFYYSVILSPLWVTWRHQLRCRTYYLTRFHGLCGSYKLLY